MSVFIEVLVLELLLLLMFFSMHNFFTSGCIAYTKNSKKLRVLVIVLLSDLAFMILFAVSYFNSF